MLIQLSLTIGCFGLAFLLIYYVISRIDNFYENKFNKSVLIVSKNIHIKLKFKGGKLTSKVYRGGNFLIKSSVGEDPDVSFLYNYGHLQGERFDQVYIFDYEDFDKELKEHVLPVLLKKD